MKITITTKNLGLTSALQDFIEKKIKKLSRFINVLKTDDQKEKTLAEIFVEVEKETKHHRKGEVFNAEVILSLPGKKLVAKSTSDNLMKAVNKVKNELENEIRKYKTKIIELPRRQSKKLKKDIF